MKFNKWSLSRIRAGRKSLTSRTTKHENDPEVIAVFGPFPLWFILNYLYQAEGADSPAELRRVINQLFRREISPSREFYVHVISPKIVMENNPE